jgi:HKD family nuclease
VAKDEFILQGFTTGTHRIALRAMFALPDIDRIVINVAYVKESGVQELETQLKAHAVKVTVFAGIRNDITSHQGLARLRRIPKLTLYTVDTGSRQIVFHPKLYVVSGKICARVLIGSANLTLGGLNNNIEAGLLLDFDLADPTDKALIDAIESQIAALPAGYPLNIVKVTSLRTLDEMLLAGRLVDEMAVAPPRPTTSAVQASGANDTVPRITLKGIRLRRALEKARGTPRRTKPLRAAKTGVSASKVPAAVGIEFEPVWESKSLTRRDLTIPKATGTHATGSVNLDKGLLPEAVDHRHYFRDDVFANLVWHRRSRTVDEAFAKF